MTQIEKFYKQLLEEIKNRQETNEDGDSEEQAFTAYFLDILSDVGETENPSVAYEERFIGTKDQLKINGFSISDNYETVDVFITLYESAPDIQNVSKRDFDNAIKRITNFYNKARSGNLDNVLADSSEVRAFADTIAHYQELEDNLVRINAVILTNGVYKGDVPEPITIGREGKYKMFYRILDLNYLYEVIVNAHAPIEIDLSDKSYKVPCLTVNVGSEDYESYIAVFPGAFIANIYETYGAKLLEQNVRSFLQFSGKINKGIKETIQKTPHRFFAYNNGLSITADKIELDKTGRFVERISNLQIVNGGQTTASIYYSAKKFKYSLDNIYVQAKISVIKSEEDFQTIVSSISQYSNTQNKVNNADFSANNPYLQAIERMSRSVMTPPNEVGRQSYWFYERVRGQYKTQKLKESFTKRGRDIFERKYPAKQVIAKDLFALYVNSYCEVWDGKKLVVSPSVVAKGKDKNYPIFINHNLPNTIKAIDEVFYEDCIAKCILYLEADKRYGSHRKGDAEPIGDLKKNTVPYTLGLLNIITENKLDLYKIWMEQRVSKELSDFIYDLMVQVNEYFVTTSPIQNYLEWGKKAECWEKFKEGLEKGVFTYDITRIADDLDSPEKAAVRRRRSMMFDLDEVKLKENKRILSSIPVALWKKIAEWGKSTDILTNNQLVTIENVIYDLKFNSEIKDKWVSPCMTIFNIVQDKNYELLLEADNIRQKETDSSSNKSDLLSACSTVAIGRQLIKEMNRFHSDRRLNIYGRSRNEMQDIEYGLKEITPKIEAKVRSFLKQLIDNGFSFDI